VISGYLITQQLVRESATTGRISLTRFWARRIRRLLPAAFTVLVVVLVVLLVLMPPVSWQQNLREIAASAGYVENWRLGFDAVDYLASENTPSMVQHYWSLSAEEQFYLVWPVLIAAVLLVGRPSADRTVVRTRRLLVLAFLGSLAASILYTPANQDLAFFATPLRAWEFAAGGLASMVSARIALGPRARALGSWVGWVAMVVLTLLLPGAKVQFPGWITLLPVAAAVCCLVAGDSESPGARERGCVAGRSSGSATGPTRSTSGTGR
jgi:peptidoglycan/LPS O-acetylase OafA/YrhL